MNEQPQVLYRIRDCSGRLLYVGRSMSICNRIRGHQRAQPWWRDAAAIELEHFDTRAEVEIAEAAAIREEDPLHNVHRYRPRVGRPTFTFELEDDLWAGLKRAEKRTGMSRPKVIRQFIRWYVGVPGAELPRRPQ